MTACARCAAAIDGPAVAGPSTVAVHPACLAACLAQDAFVLALAALALVAVPGAVVWAG